MKGLQKLSIFGVLVLILGALIFTGCQAAQKPEPEKMVVPEVTKVFFEQVEPADAPPIVRELAERFADKDASFAVLADDRPWVVVTSEDEHEEPEIKEVIQRVVNENTTVLEVMLSEKRVSPQEKRAEPLIARLNVSDLSGGVIFYEEEEKEEEAEGRAPNAVTSQGAAGNTSGKSGTRVPQESPSATKGVEQALEVDRPQPGSKVSSPLEVSGTVKGLAGVVKIRLRDGEGNILAETETAADNEGKFQATLAFDKPQNSLKGRLEVFMLQNGQEKNLRVIPLTIQ